jgi:pimeloyl-ACP methyl ester carboxylesterase
LSATDFLEVGGRRIECRRIGPGPEAAPTLVFLHEGLGSVSMWRDFPERLAAATGWGALVYSRLGYGKSDACALPRPLTYMHDEARQALPALLRAAKLRDVALVGHSDGASIAIIAAGEGTCPGLRGLVLEAPHVFCEEISVRSIAAAADAYTQGELRRRLERHHGANVDCAFWGWNRAWLDPGFRQWNIEEFLPGIAVPALVIQGADDEYGTMAQARAVEAKTGGPCEVAVFDACGHSPHRDRADDALAAMTAFIRRLG